MGNRAFFKYGGDFLGVTFSTNPLFENAIESDKKETIKIVSTIWREIYG